MCTTECALQAILFWQSHILPETFAQKAQSPKLFVIFHNLRAWNGTQFHPGRRLDHASYPIPSHSGPLRQQPSSKGLDDRQKLASPFLVCSSSQGSHSCLDTSTLPSTGSTPPLHTLNLCWPRSPTLPPAPLTGHVQAMTQPSPICTPALSTCRTPHTAGVQSVSVHQ